MKFPIPLIFLFLAASAFAGETTVTYRITGLFAPEREADLRAAMEQIPNVKLASVDFEHAEAVFIYDPSVAFKDSKPQQIVQVLSNALGSATHHTMGVVPLDPTPKDKLVRIEIPVDLLDCKACCLAAYEMIYKVDGVAAATASFKEKRITALIDPARTDRAALEAVLKKRGVAIGIAAPQ